MSTQSGAFESINLEPSVPNFGLPGTLADISDDGLDPQDFLSQSRTRIDRKLGDENGSESDTSVEKEGSFSNTRGVHSDPETPTLSNSQSLSFSKDSLQFSFKNFGDRVHHSTSPLEHLLKRQDTLTNDMSRAILLHNRLLSEGEDCFGIRETISELLAALSENSLSLQEVYSKEALGLDETLTKFHAWDKKRTKVLRRIEQIKSENNEYGAKLTGLVERKCTMDQDINALESRLASLKESRSALEKEMGETISVLESRSAKYVNMFRHLEKMGADAVLDYLDSDSVKEAGLLLRYEDVDVGFPAFRGNKKENETREHSNRPSSPKLQKQPPTVPSPSAMGAQAFEVPELEDNNGNTLTSDSNRHSTAYEKGYKKGSQQLSAVKRRISTLLMNAAPQAHESSTETRRHDELADSQNVITQKLDLKPLVALLVSKSEATSDMALQTARASESFHNQEIAWSEITRFLDTQEEKLQNSLVDASDLRVAEVSLKEVFEYLKSRLGASQTPVQNHRVADDYVRVLISQEALTVATALDQISGKDLYTLSLRSSNVKLGPPPANKKNAKDLRYSITSISSEQHNFPEKKPGEPETRFPKASRYPISTLRKDLKNE